MIMYYLTNRQASKMEGSRFSLADSIAESAKAAPGKVAGP